MKPWVLGEWRVRDWQSAPWVSHVRRKDIREVTDRLDRRHIDVLDALACLQVCIDFGSSGS